MLIYVLGWNATDLCERWWSAMYFDGNETLIFTRHRRYLDLLSKLHFHCGWNSQFSITSSIFRKGSSSSYHFRISLSLSLSLSVWSEQTQWVEKLINVNPLPTRRLSLSCESVVVKVWLFSLFVHEWAILALIVWLSFQNGHSISLFSFSFSF
jgi:hypothetical protein